MKNTNQEQRTPLSPARLNVWRMSAMAVMVAVICIFGFLSVRTALIESKEQIASSFAQRILGALVVNNSQELAKLMKSLENEPGVLMAELIANDGHTLASYSRSGQAVDYAQQAQFELATSLDDHRLHIMVPVAFDTQIIANLYLSIDLWASCLPYLLWLGGLMCLFGPLCVVIRQRRVKIRIEKITTSPTSGGSDGARFDLNQAVRETLQEADITLKFQPIKRLSDEGVFGVEVLVSWLHPSGQRLNISPADFVSLAEQSGMFLPFGTWIIDMACHQAGVWYQQHGPLVLSLNLSASQLQNPLLAEQVHAACAKSHFPHQFVEFEVNESLLLRQPALMKQAVESLVNKGMSLTLDRFGSTHQSVALLQSLPIRKIKLDHKMLDLASKDEAVSCSVKMLAAFAMSMNVHVMVDGVQSAARCQDLLAMGCMLGQGTYFGSAMSITEFSTYLASNSLMKVHAHRDTDPVSWSTQMPALSA